MANESEKIVQAIMSLFNLMNKCDASHYLYAKLSAERAIK